MPPTTSNATSTPVKGSVEEEVAAVLVLTEQICGLYAWQAELVAASAVPPRATTNTTVRLRSAAVILFMLRPIIEAICLENYPSDRAPSPFTSGADPAVPNLLAQNPAPINDFT
jgi:hypothetical protein